MDELSVALAESLLQRAEGPTLDFKEGVPRLQTKEDRAELAKDVLAFANSLDVGERAFLVYGVRDPKRGGGVTTSDVDVWPEPERVAQVLAEYTAPPPRTSFRVVTTSMGTVGVLSITGVSARPHHAVRAHDGVLNPSVVYLRRDQVNGIATSREVEHMIRQTMGEGGRRADQAPLKIGFVQLDPVSSSRTLVIRVTNVTDTEVAGIEVLLDFQHMSEPGLAARHGLLTNMTLGPGESREAAIAQSAVHMTLRTVSAGVPPQMLRVLASQLGSYMGDWWVDVTLRVFYRDRDGFLHQLTSSIALDH